MKDWLISFILLLSMGSMVIASAASLKTKDDRVNYAIGARLGKAFASNKKKNINSFIQGVVDGYNRGDKQQSYLYGSMIGRGIKRSDQTFNKAAFKAGFMDANQGKLLKLTDTEIKTITEELEQRVKKAYAVKQAALKKKLLELSAKNELASQAYLSKRKKESGVLPLENTGILYQVVKRGSGKHPALADEVVVNYKGWRSVDHKVFDDSYKRGYPVTFRLNQVIVGWKKTLIHMKPGAIWIVDIPASLAYGNHAPSPIGPGQALTFKLELISVKHVQPLKKKSLTTTQKVKK